MNKEEHIILEQDRTIQQLWKQVKELEEELEKYKWLFANQLITYTSSDVKRCETCNKLTLEENLTCGICNKCIDSVK